MKGDAEHMYCGLCGREKPFSCVLRAFEHREQCYHREDGELAQLAACRKNVAARLKILEGLDKPALLLTTAERAVWLNPLMSFWESPLISPSSKLRCSRVTGDLGRLTTQELAQLGCLAGLLKGLGQKSLAAVFTRVEVCENVAAWLEARQVGSARRRQLASLCR